MPAAEPPFAASAASQPGAGRGPAGAGIEEWLLAAESSVLGVGGGCCVHTPMGYGTQQHCPSPTCSMCIAVPGVWERR